MSLEREIKEAFMRHETDVQEKPGAWTGIERGVRRSSRLRVAASSALAIVGIVGAVVVGPKLFSTNERKAPGVAGQPASGLRIYRDETLQLQLSYPADWQGGQIFEGQVEFVPPGLAPSTRGEDSFFITVSREPGDYRRAGFFAPGGGTASQPGDTEIGGHPAVRVETKSSQGLHSMQYKIEWNGLGCPPDAEDCSGPAHLSVNMEATKDELWQTYSRTGEQLISSIRAVSRDGSPVAQGPLRTRRGTVAADIRYDALTTALASFMDARVEGGGAEYWLSQRALQQYRASDGPLDLYAPQTQSWLEYLIRERADADASSAEFTVFVRVHGTPSDPTSGFTETIGVGPGQTAGGNQLPGVIRFARLENTDAQPTAMKTYSDSTIGYSISHPADWVTDEFEGHREFRPPNQPSLAKGDPTFAVDISLESGDYNNIEGGEARSSSTTIAGQPARQTEILVEGGEHKVIYQIDWVPAQQPSCPSGAPCPVRAPQFLRIVVVGSTPELWDKYSPFGLDAVRSIERLAS